MNNQAIQGTRVAAQPAHRSDAPRRREETPAGQSACTAAAVVLRLLSSPTRLMIA
jgi:hypothetical protein